MFADGQSIVTWLEKFAPPQDSLPDDRIGLQLGTLNKSIRKVLVTLDVNDQVVDEAIQERVELIVAHHAIIYKPLTELNTSTPAGQLYEKLIKNDIAVYILHTNLDIADGGINDMMAEALDLTQVEKLDCHIKGSVFKLGRIDLLRKPVTLGQFADQVKQSFDVSNLRLVGDVRREVERVAVIGGSGGRYFEDAIKAGADVLVTGDIDYHSAQEALTLGIAMVDPGHHTEKIMKQRLAEHLQSWLVISKFETSVVWSKVDTEPFQFM